MALRWTDYLTVDPPRPFRIRYRDGRLVAAEVIGAQVLHDDLRCGPEHVTPGQVCEYCVLFADRHIEIVVATECGWHLCGQPVTLLDLARVFAPDTRPPFAS
ncbi:hypothetical protein [Nocardia sp. NPDC050406]|uniref:hypothetical protein n=1 Tax=Nocardia sp. NPDC050406 TaxID=3364318 RepID=UPI00379E97BD